MTIAMCILHPPAEVIDQPPRRKLGQTRVKADDPSSSEKGARLACQDRAQLAPNVILARVEQQ
jgi:hypothetical protein